MKTTILHNPKCTKSRQGLALLKEQGIDSEVIEYLKDNPDAAELRNILSKLGVKAEALIRKKEAIYKELYQGKTLSEEEWIAAMVKYPKLIERPIVIRGNKAVIGRPTERIFDLF